MKDYPSVFDFDDDALSRRFEQAVVVEVEPSASDFTVEAYQAVSDPIKIPSARRRSSVYRRLSIKASSVASHNAELYIPTNFGNNLNEDEEDGGKHQRKLADFEPLKVLGQGAYGKVHLVQDRHTGKLYAQKQLRKPVIDIHDTARSPGHTTHVKRTIYERQILTQITHHPNIVKLFYALQDHDKFYLILEYIPGGELFHHLTSNNSLGNAFAEDDVAFYSAQMALGLKHLHGLGIVYRDLKPENCLLNSQGHLVLTDFGLSKTISDDENCTAIIGTPEYMAPEILKGESYDYAVDWWSLGCVIYDMMSGKPPFTGNSHKVIQDKIVKNKPAMPFYFAMDAKDLLNKLLNKNPTKRFKVDSQWEQFASHRFYRKVDWAKLANRDDSIRPPIVPVISDPILAENFSADFTNLRVSDYHDQSVPDTSPFEVHGFSYTASTSFIDRYS